jgi:putative PIN family toxin of toxin-antitoxin system
VIRAVADTNVLVSGTIAPLGNPARILQAWRRGEFLLVSSPAIVAEVLEVLARPHIARHYPLSAEALDGLRVLLETETVQVPGTRQVRVVADDPDDDLFVAVALEGEADYIVSGDPHLLGLKEVQSIQIVTPRDFLACLAETKRDV